MGDQEKLKQILARCAKLANQVATKSAKAASSSGTWDNNASEARQLAELIQRLMAKASSVHYDRPVRVIVADTDQRLRQKPPSHLATCVNNVAWILYLLFPDVNQYPPQFERLLAVTNLHLYVWRLMVDCYRGMNSEPQNSASYLLLHNPGGTVRRKKIIIEEGGVGPLLRVLKEGGPKEQMAAAKKLGSLFHDLEIAIYLVDAGVLPVFAKILEEGVMEVRAEVEHAISELAKTVQRPIELQRMIIDKGEAWPYLKSLKKGGPREQAAAAKALGSLLHNLESPKHLVAAGVFPVFAKILEEGFMEVRAEVAHAISELAKILQQTLERKRRIIEPGGGWALLKLLKEGGPREQVVVAEVLGSLFHDLVAAGVFPVFAKIFEGGVMEVWAEVAHAISELAKILQQTLKCGKLIIEEGGVRPLLKLLKEGEPREQVVAAKALGSLLHDLGSAEHLVAARVVPMFAQILQEGVMEVQAEVAHAVSVLVEIDPRCQDSFAEHQAIRSLVTHLAFEIVEGHLMEALTINKATSVLSIVKSRYRSNVRKIMDEDDEQNNATLPSHQENLSATDTAAANTKARRKAMAAKALASLARGNASICRAIVERGAIMCFAVLMEKGKEDVKYYSVKALMEITSVAEQDTDLRRLAFRPSSPAFKAIVDQLVKIIESCDSEPTLLVSGIKASGKLATTFQVTELVKIIESCDSESTLLVSGIKAIGNLARTFRVTETRIIIPLVRLLDLEKVEVCREASIALTKFVSGEDLLHLDNARAILGAGGAKQLVLVIHSEEVIIQKPALILLCHIVLQVSDSDELVRDDALSALNFASRKAIIALLDEAVLNLVKKAKGRLRKKKSRISE